VRARVPASSANLGPGFDTLAVALGLYVTVTVTPAPSLSVVSTGEGASLPQDASHLAARVATSVAGTPDLSIIVHSEIPLARGLGSSAALAVAAAAAAGAGDPLSVATRVAGPPENAAASVMGGLVTATMVEGSPVARSLPLDNKLRFVVLVPSFSLPTKEARTALPATVNFADAAFNLGRMGLLVSGLADHRHLLAGATEDRLHQPWRSHLFPQAAWLLAELVDRGAVAACWSGAGPSLLAICTVGTVGTVAAAAAELMELAGVPGRVLECPADYVGLEVEAEK
jgi:homoserine kinase